MRSRLSEVSRRGVRQPLARLLVPGLLLGLPFSGLVSCKTGEAASKPAPDVTASQCANYPNKVKVRVTSQGIVFESPDGHVEKEGRLCKNGRATFLNECSKEVSIDVNGPSPDLRPIMHLPPGKDLDQPFSTVGKYKIAAEDCPDIPQDAKTGTLEVGTGTGG